MDSTERVFMFGGFFRRSPAMSVLIATLIVASGCDQKQNKFVPPPPPRVTVSRPVQQAVTDYLYLTGNTQAVDQVQLQARVEGFLKSIHLSDGDYVKKGDLLFLIEQDVYQTKVQQAEGQPAGTWNRRHRRYAGLNPDCHTVRASLLRTDGATQPVAGKEKKSI